MLKYFSWWGVARCVVAQNGSRRPAFECAQFIPIMAAYGANFLRRYVTDRLDELAAMRRENGHDIAETQLDVGRMITKVEMLQRPRDRMQRGINICEIDLKQIDEPQSKRRRREPEEDSCMRPCEEDTWQREEGDRGKGGKGGSSSAHYLSG